MNYDYLKTYMSQKGGWDFSNYSRNSRIQNSINGTFYTIIHIILDYSYNIKLCI